MWPRRLSALNPPRKGSLLKASHFICRSCKVNRPITDGLILICIPVYTTACSLSTFALNALKNGKNEIVYKL